MFASLQKIMAEVKAMYGLGIVLRIRDRGKGGITQSVPPSGQLRRRTDLEMALMHMAIEL